MNRSVSEIISEITEGLVGEKIWYISCCGAAGSTFGLDLGGKKVRKFPLKNKTHSEEFRQYEGEVRVNVWCTWRLDNSVRPVTSSDDTDEGIKRGLDQLKERKITDIQIVSPCWDLHVKFNGDLILHVFTDHIPGAPSFDGNWEVWLRERAFFFGPGTKIEIQERDKENTK